MPNRNAQVGDSVIYRNAAGQTMNALVTAAQFRGPSTALFTLSTSTSGGTLAAATYSYIVTVVVGGIESLASVAKTIVTTGATSTVTVDATALLAAYPTATAWKVYGRTGGSELFMATTNAPTATFVDTAAVTPSGALPAATASVKLRIPSTHQVAVAGVPKQTTLKGTGVYWNR